ncbi:hypothetical protein KJ359_009739 [Pestalotiopsis sp. 9143b]|nr:hypothetical protein KJ359_009739 [Pestalotiopsis sp. 9143b]
MTDILLGEVEGRGAFGYYTVANENISFKVPEGFALEKAATVPLASATAWLALFSKDSLGIPMRSDPAISVLIWGGSSSVGQYAIQIAASHGFNVITTCSPKYFETVKSLGARHVFDYHDQDVATKIKEASSTIHYAFDTIGQKHSSATASQALALSGETQSALCTVRPGKANTEDVEKGVKVTDVLVWTAFLKDHRYGEFFWPASDFDHEICVDFFKKLPDWLRDGKLRASVPSLKHGLDSVADGFQEYRDGKISGYKLVYRIQE